MKYIEMTIEEAIKHCCKNQKVLVAIHDLENSDINIFIIKKYEKYKTFYIIVNFNYIRSNFNIF